MTAFQLWVTHPLVHCLGLALLHFLWQGAAVALLLAAALTALSRASAHSRYAAACLALLFMAILPAATFRILMASSAQSALKLSELNEAGLEVSAPMADYSERAAAGAPAPARIDHDAFSAAGRTFQGGLLHPGWSAAIPFWAAAAWALGVAILSLRLLGGWIYLQHLKSRRTRPAPGAWLEALSRLRRAMRIGRPVRLLQSAGLQVPAVIGWLRPAIIIPAAAVSGLPIPHLEALLAHELAHIRRHDYLVNLLQAFVETAFFYHPAVWWVSRQVRLERENCCDDLALAACGSRAGYARALVEMEELRAAPPPLAAAWNGSDFLPRVQRILGIAAAPARVSVSQFACLITLGILLALGWAVGLKAEKPVDDCDVQFQSIRGLYETIPVDFRNLKEPLDPIKARIQDCCNQLEKFLAACPAAQGSPKARYMLARLLLLQRLPDHKDYKDFLKRAMVLAKEAMATAGEKDLLRARCLYLLGEAHFLSREFAEALESYRPIPEQFPGYPDIGQVGLALGQTYLALGRTSEGLALMRRLIQERPQDREWPHYHELIWKLSEADGDLAAMEEHCREVQRRFPESLHREGIRKSEREDLQRYLGYSGFRLGYVLFAGGEVEKAKSSFQQHIDELNRWEDDFNKQGLSFPQELQIFRNRSKDISQVIESQFGRPPARDLEGVIWATPRKATITGSAGKAAAVIFRGSGDARSAEFLKQLDRHALGDPAKKVLVSLSYLKKPADLPANVAELQREAAKLGLEAAALGFDPDPENKALFRSFNVRVGSATFLVFDPQGKLAWYQQDPREVDVRLAVRIWDRIAKNQ